MYDFYPDYTNDNILFTERVDTGLGQPDYPLDHNPRPKQRYQVTEAMGLSPDAHANLMPDTQRALGYIVGTCSMVKE